MFTEFMLKIVGLLNQYIMILGTIVTQMRGIVTLSHNPITFLAQGVRNAHITFIGNIQFCIEHSKE